MMKTKILITGAGGFLGGAIAKKLALDPRYEIYSFSRGKYPILETFGVKQFSGNLKHYPDVVHALKGMDAIIHTASMVGMWGKYEDFYQTNVIGTKNIIQAMKEHKIKKLVYTSTPSVAFDRESLCGVDESTPKPKSYLTYYAETKSMAEELVLKASHDELDSLLSVSLRPHLIFGPGDTNLIPRVVEAHKKGRLKIIGDGENLVDVTYVENAADAHIMALEALSPGHAIVGKAYFVGQGPVKLWEFTNKILVKAHLPIVSKKISLKAAYRIGFIFECLFKIFRIQNSQPPMTRFIALQLGKSHYFSHKNLEQDLGFRPKISIDVAIENCRI